MIRAAADQRSGLPDNKKVPVFFYIDEAHTVIKRDEKLASLIAECRSQKVALILAHQWLEQIELPKYSVHSPTALSDMQTVTMMRRRYPTE